MQGQPDEFEQAKWPAAIFLYFRVEGSIDG
jgi:hypothetical protein